jgi:hypothetical protein
MWLVRFFLCYSGGGVVEGSVVYSCVVICVRNKKWLICNVVSTNPLRFNRAEYVLFL